MGIPAVCSMYGYLRFYLAIRWKIAKENYAFHFHLQFFLNPSGLIKKYEINRL